MSSLIGTRASSLRAGLAVIAILLLGRFPFPRSSDRPLLGPCEYQLAGSFSPEGASPAPDLTPAETKNQARTHIGIGTANVGTSSPH